MQSGDSGWENLTTQDEPEDDLLVVRSQPGCQRCSYARQMRHYAVRRASGAGSHMVIGARAGLRAQATDSHTGDTIRFQLRRHREQ